MCGIGVTSLIMVTSRPVSYTHLDVYKRQLPEKNRDHELGGDWVGHRECRIQPDWLLIYRIEDDVLVLTLARTGTHSDLFEK